MIPGTFHQVWLGSEVPERFHDMMETWRTHHPEWSFRLWTDENRPRPLTNEILFNAAGRYVAPNRIGQMQSDILRYEILYRYGGVYVDVDTECLRPIDALVADVGCFLAWERQDVWAGNTYVGSRPMHPFIGQLIRLLPESAKLHKGQVPSVISGPQFITRQLKAKRSEEETPVRIYPQRWFYPYAYNELDRAGERFEEAYAVHHWDNQRKMKGKPL